jgi:hypothetical protein
MFWFLICEHYTPSGSVLDEGFIVSVSEYQVLKEYSSYG